MAYVYRGTNRDAKPVPDFVPVQAPPPKPAKPVFDPTKCGTYPGYGQHRRHRTPPCADCLEAQRVYKRDWLNRRRNNIPIKRATFNPDKCGTYSGYTAHLRYKITPCLNCKRAHNEYMAEYRTRKALEISAEEAS